MFFALYDSTKWQKMNQKNSMADASFAFLTWIYWQRSIRGLKKAQAGLGELLDSSQIMKHVWKHLKRTQIPYNMHRVICRMGSISPTNSNVLFILLRTLHKNRRQKNTLKAYNREKPVKQAVHGKRQNKISYLALASLPKPNT